jgi:hypothetical protein
MARHVLELRLPVFQVVFGVIQDLARLVRVFPCRACVTWYDGRVVEEVEEAAAVAG